MNPTAPPNSAISTSLRRRYREFALIARDPVLMISLLYCGLFLFIFVIFPLYRGTASGFLNADAAGPWYTRLSLKYFARFFDSYYGPYQRQVLLSTLEMGLLTAFGGTVLGFIFAYTMVRCSPPLKGLIHVLALVPTVSPPFALALSTILLFGRNGLVTHKLLGINFIPGANDVYGLDGLVFVQVITFFSVAYLIVRAMLERLDPSMEEAAHSLGAGKFHIFRTVTLPLLVPGIAGSFLLLFVESLADLGNPLFISGNVTVLSAQIWLAVAGEYDYQKASALAFVLLLPTLAVFLVQRYYVTRRSYVSVTGKPTGGHIMVREPYIRWPFIVVTSLMCVLIVVLYATIIYGSFANAWGTDFSPTLRHWELLVTRGVEAVLDTTFLSAFATPIAALTGMVIAFLVVRKRFSGKDTLDFVSNLGGAVPGTILGIGFVLAFATPPWFVVAILYGFLAFYLVTTALKTRREQLLVLLIGTTAGVGLALLFGVLDPFYVMYILGGVYLLLGIVAFATGRGPRTAKGLLSRVPRPSWLLLGMGLYLLLFNWIDFVAQPIADLSRAIPRGFWSNAIFQISDHVKVFFQTPTPLTAIVYTFLSVLVIADWRLRIANSPRDQSEIRNPKSAVLLTGGLLALIAALCFMGQPLALVGSPFIIIAAFVVRSLPASVRSGVAALQQIDPSIEEASGILGADAQYTFRKVTLPLIMPALLAGLIFSFTRSMTSLSAIIFLVSARWRIVTASIMSEWEQGGVAIAAGYSTVIIVLVMIAIGVLYFVTRKLLGGRGDVDLTLGV
ncbi:MAG: iron ABC transporter permease [Chloroflexi bacterium]|nr:iron ABC transporter permease [Chloroflexota bacterium]